MTNEPRYMYIVKLRRRSVIVEETEVRIRPGCTLSKAQAIQNVSNDFYDGKLKDLTWKERSKDPGDIDDDDCTVKRVLL